MKVEHDKSKELGGLFAKKFWIIQKLLQRTKNDGFFGVLSKLALTMLMIFSMKAVFINIFQSVKTVCSKKISS